MTDQTRMPGTCAHCGIAIERRSRRGPFPKYCTPAHRTRAWRQRQLEDDTKTPADRMKALVLGYAKARGITVHQAADEISDKIRATCPPGTKFVEITFRLPPEDQP